MSIRRKFELLTAFSLTLYALTTRAQYVPSEATPGIILEDNGAGGGRSDSVTEYLNYFQRTKEFPFSLSYTDIREFGARTTNYANVPVAGTARCTASSTLIPISGINGNAFFNGDGVFLPRCGPSPTFSAPTISSVTPVHPTDLLNTNHTVPDTSGATQYCFSASLVEWSGAITAASPPVCTAKGPSSLGQQKATVSGCTRSNYTVTCNGTGFGFTAGTRVYLSNSDADTTWSGFFITATATSTSFTFTTNLDTRNGATAASLGNGTVYWENGIQIALNSNPGGDAAFYIIYETSPSALLLGPTLPLNLENGYSDPFYGVFTYYGAQIGAPFNFASWIPTTPLASAQNGYLATTILAGANGTSNTTIRVANAPSNSASTTMTLDNGPNIVNAANYVATNGGYLYFPVSAPLATSSPYYIQSFTDVGNVNILLGTSVLANGTLKTSGRIMGMATTPCAFPQFAIGCFTGISDGTAYPTVWTTSSYMERMYVTGAGNGYLGVLDSGYQAAEYKNVIFVGGADSDCMGLPFMRWGSSGGSFGGTWDRILFSTGPNPQINGNCTSASGYWRNDAEISMNAIYINRRGLAFQPADYGLQLTFNQGFEEQGGIDPVISFLRYRPGAAGINARIATITPDTQAVPNVVNFAGNSSALAISLYMENDGAPSSGWVQISGKPIAAVHSIGASYGQLGQNTNVSTDNEGLGYAYDGIFGATYLGGSVTPEHHNKAMILGSSNQFFTDTGRFPAPTCVVQPGGSIAVGTYTLTYHPLYYNGTATGGEGEPSLPCTYTTSPGNQSVKISGVKVPNAIAYDVFNNHGLIGSCALGYVTRFPYTWTGSPKCGASEPGIPGTGPAGIQGNLMWAPNVAAYKQIQPSANTYAGTCVFSASITCSITYANAYTNTPVVLLTPVNPGAITFTLTSTSNTGFTITASGSNSLTVNWAAIGNPN